MRTEEDSRGLVRTVVADGVPLLLLTAVGLVFAGGLCLFLALTGEFLPHDIRHLGMTAAELCAEADCRVVEFMIHDRAAFGGALIAVGTLYAYVVLFPLRGGQAWAWWLLAVSGTAGFLSFLAYLGYGYLDTWHGIGTLVVLPVFVAGMVQARRLISVPLPRPLWRLPNLRGRSGWGRAALLAGALGTAAAGAEILRIGVMETFVPEDLAFMGVSADQLTEINSRLIPLIAHDRAGFGGAVLTTGLVTVGVLWFAHLSRALWETLLIAGTVSLGSAIGIHFVVGYIDAWHLAPPALGVLSLVIGLVLTRRDAYSTG